MLGVLGNAASFPGTSGSGIKASLLSASTGDWSAFCWLYLVGLPGSSATIMKNGRTGGGNNGWAFSVNSAGRLTLSDPGGAWGGTASTAMSTGTWYHVGFIRSGTSTQMYVNSIADGAAVSGTFNNPENDFTLGATYNDSSVTYVNVLNGYIDQALIWTRALDPINELPKIDSTILLPFSTGNMVGYYKLDESAGAGVVMDYSTNVKNGSVVGSTTFVAGNVTTPGVPNRTTASTRTNITPHNSALSFPGTSSDFGILKSGTILCTLANASVAMWIKTTQSTNINGYPLYCERAASGNDLWKFEIRNAGGTGKLELVHRDDSGTLDLHAGSTPITVNDGQWHHVALTKSGTTIKIYIDGGLQSTDTLTGNDTMTDAGLQVRIGGDKGDGTVFYNGNMDDLRLYNTTLSATDVANLFNKNDVPTGLIDWYKFDENGGSSIIDSAGSNNGTLFGNVTFVEGIIGGSGGRGLVIY